MGIATCIDSVHGIAHNKIIIIDREVVITGNFNSYQFTTTSPYPKEKGLRSPGAGRPMADNQGIGVACICAQNCQRTPALI